jgi:hypothetical protein
MLVLWHALKAYDPVVVIIAQSVHKICTGNPYTDNCDLHPATDNLAKDPIKTLTIPE